MSKLAPKLLATLVLLIVCVPALVSGESLNPGAAENGWWLVPDCARKRGVDACRFGDIALLLRKALKFAVYLIIPLATVGILVTGIRLVISGEGEKEGAKQSMQNIVIGIFLTLGAYLLVDTILKFLAKDAIKIP